MDITRKLNKVVLSIRSDRIPVLKPTRFVVNWGNTESLDIDWKCKVLNLPKYVNRASDKLETFQILETAELNIPKWSTDMETAKKWIEKGHTVFCRTLTRANSGRGIVIAETEDQLVNAPLYTRYIKKAKEFRVHVFKNEVLDVQEKRLAHGVEDKQFLIRNHANGFVFCRDNINKPDGLEELAIKAVKALELDFGAVDIIYNAHYGKCYILEVNTAPGIEGTTLDNYSNRFIKEAYAQ